MVLVVFLTRFRYIHCIIYITLTWPKQFSHTRAQSTLVLLRANDKPRCECQNFSGFNHSTPLLFATAAAIITVTIVTLNSFFTVCLLLTWFNLKTSTATENYLVLQTILLTYQHLHLQKHYVYVISCSSYFEQHKTKRRTIKKERNEKKEILFLLTHTTENQFMFVSFSHSLALNVVDEWAKIIIQQ